MSSHPSEKPASAAAMDALDLDDLFLEGDDGPSLFADMEIDLDNMGGIFDAPAPAGPAAASTYDNQRGGGVGRDNVLIGRQSSSASSTTRGKRVRTAKTNPHLLAAEQQEGNESAQKRQSAIQKELQRLQDSNDVLMFGEPINSKRKRRRSKKVQEEEESQKKEAETSSSSAAAATTGKVASKKKRRSSKITTQQMDLQSAAQTQQQPLLHQQQQALQQIFHQMNPQQQEMLQKKAEAMGLNIFASSSSSSSNSPALQAQSLSNLLLYQQENNINDCGLQPSTSFYPFRALPPELDIKRGQKLFPVLEKINATSVRHINTDSEQQALHSSNTFINATSPLYTLFHQHLGLIQNENSNRGIYDLVEATRLANGFMMNEDGKKRMVQELSRLLAQCLKQTAFIKQNMSNLESFVKGGEARWSNADIQSLFPDPKPKVGTSVAASSSGGSINTEKISSVSKRGSLSTSGGPIISVKVKVRVPGWRDKSGARLVGKLSCPPGWKVAMKRENLKAEAKKAASENVVTPSSTTTTTTTTTTRSTASRKRTTKESSSSAPTPPVTNKITTEELKIAVPFVSAYQDDQQQQRETTTQIPNQEHQDSSILHNLYTKILRPSISPSQRRELLASEISSTVSRLESARLSGQWAKARKLQEQMKALQSVYKDDIDIVPDMCNTIGMWRWMEHTNYFKDIEGEEEVYQELEDCVHDANEEDMFESKSSILEEGTLWGSSGMLEKRRVSTTTTDGSEEGNEENTDRMNDDIEPSPLFDRLQSLLVEIDGSDDDEDDDEDDDIIASLPHFSPYQFINGPASGNNESENGMIDVSALTLDQRTYIQLCAVGLIDATIPPSSVMKRAMPAASTSDKEEDGESIDQILHKMKMRLSDLQSNNMEVTALQRKALLHVKQAPERKQRERDEDAVLAKYKQMQKMQNEEKDEKKRTSSRTRASSG